MRTFNPVHAMTTLGVLLMTLGLVAPGNTACVVGPAGGFCDRNVRVVVPAPSAGIIHLGGVDGLRHDEVTPADRVAWMQRCTPRLVSGELYNPDTWTYAYPDCARGPRRGDAGR